MVVAQSGPSPIAQRQESPVPATLHNGHQYNEQRKHSHDFLLLGLGRCVGGRHDRKSWGWEHCSVCIYALPLVPHPSGTSWEMAMKGVLSFALTLLALCLPCSSRYAGGVEQSGCRCVGLRCDVMDVAGVWDGVTEVLEQSVKNGVFPGATALVGDRSGILYSQAVSAWPGRAQLWLDWRVRAGGELHVRSPTAFLPQQHHEGNAPNANGHSI